MDREGEVSKIFIINISTVCLTGSDTISNPEEQPQISDVLVGQKQNESIQNYF